MKKIISKISADQIYLLEHYKFNLILLLQDVTYVKHEIGNEKARSLLKELNSIITYINILRHNLHIPDETPYVGFYLYLNNADEDVKTYYLSSKNLIQLIFKDYDLNKNSFVDNLNEAKKIKKPGWYFMKYNQYLKELFGNFENVFFNEHLEVSNIKIT